MGRKIKLVVVVLLSISIVASSNMVTAKTSDEIIFKDKNLQSALNKYYDWNGVFTKANADELSQKDDNVFLDYAEISDLEGLQYFDNLISVDLEGNNLSNLETLSQMKKLELVNISYNAINGEKLEDMLSEMGSIQNLECVRLYNNRLVNIDFLTKIGNISNYTHIEMDNNEINNISMLKNATSLYFLDLSDNRITDVSPLKDLKELTFYLDLRDNCIIDYKPIKPLLDAMFEDVGDETGLERYDYYTNPVNFTYDGKTIKFPFFTTYYKYQAYAEAIPLFKAFGGSALYNKKTGTLTCKYDGNVLIMKDFSKKATLNGEKITLDYPMRRMQYDLAYIPVKDVCEVLGLNYDVVKTRKINHDYKYIEYAPKSVKISKAVKELG